jgi:hypothetical protein
MTEQININTETMPGDEQARRTNKKSAKRAYDEVEAARTRYGRTLCAKAQAQSTTYSIISERSS